MHGYADGGTEGLEDQLFTDIHLVEIRSMSLFLSHIVHLVLQRRQGCMALATVDHDGMSIPDDDNGGFSRAS